MFSTGEATATNPRRGGGWSRPIGLMKGLSLRVVTTLVVTVVSAHFLAWEWAGAWFATIWTLILATLALIARAQAATGTPRESRLRRMVMAGSFLTAVVHAAIAVALWRAGDPLAERFAVIIVFVAAAYVLHHYYSDLQTFRLMISPSVAAFAYVSWETLDRGNYGPVQLLTVAAGTILLFNFFRGSRTMLAASRAALVQAQAQAEAANTAKSSFLATMSHEIRTPLNGVLGMAQAMAADTLEPQQRERLAVIHQSGDALLAILNDILDLAKIEAGKLEVEAIAFDLEQVARDAHDAFSALAQSKGLGLRLDVAAAEGVYRGDPLRLRQVLTNLMSNAVKFTERGEVRLVAAPVAGGVRFTVSDTGIGIPADRLSGLFSAFEQGDATTTRRFGGTGLGLAICRQLAELMGGRITAESEPGLGTRFHVTLPLERIDDARAAGTGDLPAAEGFAPRPLRVLAAEDNSVNQLVLKTLLAQVGVEPVMVDDGQTAVAAWAGGEWDVILMDVQMPGMDGPTATRLIRASEARTGRRRTPIVALTANAMSHQVAEYRASGMDGFVSKPIEAGKLFEALQVAVDSVAATARSGVA